MTTGRRIWIKWLGAGVLVLAVLFGWRVLTYYQQIQNGSVDVSAFSDADQQSLLSGSSTTTSATQATSLVENFADDPTLGPDDAQITIVAFEDFECPFCARATPIIKQVLAKYPTTVRFVYRDFPLSQIHPQANTAAQAANCAHEQGAFWPYHDLLFANQDALAVSDLQAYAARLNLNVTQFTNCLDTRQFDQEVQADFADGLAAGVTGTPTFFFNGYPVAGVISAEGFDAIIAQLLSTQ